MLEKLGEGGMARVYKCRDKKLRRLVAIKRLSGRDAKAIERFQREAEALAALSHPNIIVIYEYPSDEVGFCIVMEFAAGGDLRKDVKAKGPYPEERCVEVIEAVANALAHAHGSRSPESGELEPVVHRDIKPSNILLTAEGTPKLSDFGLARLEGRTAVTLTGAGMGTPAYMAPEQVEGAHNVGPRADIYSLGKTLYFMATGQEPTTIIPDDLPPRLRKVVIRCIKEKPTDRFPSADALIEALHARTRRGRWLSRGATVALVSLIIAAVAVWYLGARSPGAQPIRTGEQEPRELRGAAYAAALERAEGRPAEDAIKIWQEFLAAEPGSSYAVRARDSLEKARQRLEAVRQARRDEEEEKHAFDAVASTEAEQAPAEAVGAWEKFLEEHPDGKRTAGATKRLQQAREHLARALREEAVPTEPKLPGDLESAFEVPMAAKDRYDNPVRRATDPKTGWAFEIRHKGTGMHFVFIPPGKFMMGSGLSIKEILKQYDLAERYEVFFRNEHPRHRVRLTEPFYLAKYEMTQGEWKKIMESEPWQEKAFARDNLLHAVSYVSWDECQELVKKLNAGLRGTRDAGPQTRNALQFTLPTEAQWEYACRAGAETMYCFGDGASKLGEYAWFAQDLSDKGEGHAHPVGRRMPNRWGLYDMHGNVWEWCQDWYGTYGEGEQTDPTGALTGTHRVFRSGCLADAPQYCRAAFRGSDIPSGRNFAHGLRLALSPVRQ